MADEGSSSSDYEFPDVYEDVNRRALKFIERTKKRWKTGGTSSGISSSDIKIQRVEKEEFLGLVDMPDRGMRPNTVPGFSSSDIEIQRVQNGEFLGLAETRDQRMRPRIVPGGSSSDNNVHRVEIIEEPRRMVAMPRKIAQSGGSWQQGQQKQILEKFRLIEEQVRTETHEWSTKPPTIVDLAEGKNGSYTPKVVCIGPLFDNKRKTAVMVRMEHYKWCCVRKLIMGRNQAGTSESAEWSIEVHATLLRKCFVMMMRLAPQVRVFYCNISSSKDTNGAVGMTQEDLAMMMLFDSGFVLHLLLKYAREGYGGSDDDDWNQQLGHCCVSGTMKRDLLLLSNQVPFFVLRKLFKRLRISRITNERDDIIVNGGLQLFSLLHPRRLHSAPIACHGVHHLLHLFYLSIDFPPSSWQHDSTRQHDAMPPEQTLSLPCAKELVESGVRFRARKHGAASFLDVRFCRGILEIPPLELFDYSEPLFRNLIAFEQTYTAMPGRITAYAIFMNSLLKTPQDIHLLHRSGVLVNHMNGNMSDTTMMGFFSSLCAEMHTSPDRNYLAGVMEEIVRYQHRKWPRWPAALVSNNFTNPWVTTSVVAVVIFLTMIVFNTLYTVAVY